MRTRVSSSTAKTAIERRTNRELLLAVNAAHAGTGDAEEVRLARVRQARHRKAMLGAVVIRRRGVQDRPELLTEPRDLD
jgi:hypothetical protein